MYYIKLRSSAWINILQSYRTKSCALLVLVVSLLCNAIVYLEVCFFFFFTLPLWQITSCAARWPPQYAPPVRAKFEDRSFFRLRNIEGVPKFRHWGTCPRRRPISGQFVVRGQELPTAYVHAKFEGRSFIRLRNIGTFRCGALIDPVTVTFGLEVGMGVACDLGYPCGKFRRPRPFGFRVRADVRDIRQTDDGRRSSLNAPAPLRGGCIITNVSETIRKPPLAKPQTALRKQRNKIWRKTIFNMADGFFTSCNVACGSGIMTVNSPSGSTLQCGRWLWDDMPLNLPKRPTYWNSIRLVSHSTISP